MDVWSSEKIRGRFLEGDRTASSQNGSRAALSMILENIAISSSLEALCSASLRCHYHKKRWARWRKQKLPKKIWKRKSWKNTGKASAQTRTVCTPLPSSQDYPNGRSNKVGNFHEKEKGKARGSRQKRILRRMLTSAIEERLFVFSLLSGKTTANSESSLKSKNKREAPIDLLS